MSKFEVWWVDDEPERESEEAESLDGEQEELNVVFYNPDEALEILSSIEEGTGDCEAPDLVLGDWYLNEVGEYEFKGLTFEARLREVFSDVPFYGFSGEETADFGGQLSEERFDRVCNIRELTSGNAGKEILEDIKDYQKVKDAVGGDIGDIMELLDASDEARREQIRASLPGEFENGIPSEDESGRSSGLQFARWVRNRFLQIPGPISGALFTATKLGVKRSVFKNKYQTDFESSKYRGIFSYTTKPRWWQTSVIRKLVKMNDDPESSMGEPWMSGPQILDVDPENRPVCEVCRKKHPETVAQTESSPTDTFPVHFGCSRIQKQREGAFSERRVIPSDQ